MYPTYAHQSMRHVFNPLLAAWLLTAAGATHSGSSSIATIPMAGGKVIFELEFNRLDLAAMTGIQIRS